ncbi:MAG: translation initiation factor IF-3 [Cardiobacteriaceae bacterium]|nr:translation initiation factor IF-3 [Cardiobacteriaceae bacterium]
MARTDAKQNEPRKNEEIREKSVLLIGADGEQVGVVSIEQALDKAFELNLDLVEVAANAKPPVCKLMDYNKFRFEQQKKQKEARKNQKQIQIKELKFRPGTDVGDYQVKLRNLVRFLNDGDKVKITVRFRGRELAHQDLGQKLLDRIEAETAEIAVVEQKAGMEGRQMVMLLAPTKK